MRRRRRRGEEGSPPPLNSGSPLRMGMWSLPRSTTPGGRPAPLDRTAHPPSTTGYPASAPGPWMPRCHIGWLPEYTFTGAGSASRMPRARMSRNACIPQSHGLSPMFLVVQRPLEGHTGIDDPAAHRRRPSAMRSVTGAPKGPMRPRSSSRARAASSRLSSGGRKPVRC